ncbi:MAG TPA: MBL fold metallo-hydrolase [Candidatus Saccharimonadales bacterium]|nr:MBL fold metallo-hydrolase [Candidatus Saccharimonadales bacterium]
MKVTKYPQSCLLIERDNKRIIIDPGSLVTGKYKATDLLPLDAILITHEHPDHADPSLIIALVGQAGIPVVANESATKMLGNLVNKTISDNEEFEVAGFKIKARDLPHCAMVDGSPGPQNTGYVIESTFFHPGDGIKISDLTVQTTAVPIAGPDISPRDVHEFIESVGCNTVIPIHYEYFPADPNFYKRLLSSDGKFDVIVLNNGESTEIK